jgi:toxin ParE1/3/4
LKHPVRLTALAEADIAQAFRWYEAKKPYLGEEFIERVEEAIEKIAQNPTLHAKLIEDVRRVDVRKFPYGIWYRVEDDGSVVIACLHHKREPALAKARALGISPKPTDPSPS